MSALDYVILAATALCAVGAAVAVRRGGCGCSYCSQCRKCGGCEKRKKRDK